jgi:hypothetical protein
MQLLMAIEERRSGIVGDEIKFYFLESPQHHHVLHHTCCRLATDAYKIEAVPVQMERVNIVAGIAKLES